MAESQAPLKIRKIIDENDTHTYRTCRIDGAKFDHRGPGEDVRGVLNYSSFEVTGTIPEPSTAGLLGGLLALSSVMVRRRR